MDVEPSHIAPRLIVLNTGTELLLGQVVNTHLAFIAREIFPLGLRVERQLTVSDGPAILEALTAVSSEADVILVTGGLGPTTDDVTREAAAELLDLPLVKNPAIAAAITERLRLRGFPMTDRILRQADVPEGATVLPNQNGTAPGIYLAARERGGKRWPHIFLLPGPPREFEPMFREQVTALLRKIAPPTSRRECRTFRLACVGESVVEAAIGPRLLALPEVELGYCARAGEVDVRVIGPEPTLDEAEAIIREGFPLQLFTTGEENLEEALLRMLRNAGATLATAESCTGGYLAHRLTNVPGASAVFTAGFVVYANEAKIATLGLDEGLIEKHGAVSTEVARAMAIGALQKGKADYALATTGIAGPDGGSEEKPVGTVFIALASANAEPIVLRRLFLAERATFKHHVAQTAFQMLRERLLEEAAG